MNGKREERNYEGGVLTGPAVVYGTDGDKFEFTYVEGKIQGMNIHRNKVYFKSIASFLWRLICLLKMTIYNWYNVGPAVYYAANGASEERTYCDSISHGPATLYLPNGDSEERMYESGQLHGIATFVSHTGDRCDKTYLFTFIFFFLLRLQ